MYSDTLTTLIEIPISVLNYYYSYICKTETETIIGSVKMMFK